MNACMNVIQAEQQSCSELSEAKCIYTCRANGNSHEFALGINCNRIQGLDAQFQIERLTTFNTYTTVQVGHTLTVL